MTVSGREGWGSDEEFLSVKASNAPVSVNDLGFAARKAGCTIERWDQKRGQQSIFFCGEV